MTPWGQKAIEDVARAIATDAGYDWIRLHENELTAVMGVSRASFRENARAAILAYNAALREPSAEIISAGSGVSMEISANQVSHALEAMLTRADEEIAP